MSPGAACRALAIVALALLGVVGCRGGGTDYLSFRTAFGRSLSDFEREVLEHLGQVLR